MPDRCRRFFPPALAIRLTGTGVRTAIRQLSALLLRHWWPVAATAALFSRRLRRTLLAAGVADAYFQHRNTRPELDLLRFLCARRLDDLAYGTGVWKAALRARSPAALLPTLARRWRNHSFRRRKENQQSRRVPR